MEKENKQFNKKGVSGVDVAVAIIVISIGLSIIVSLLIIINQTTNKVNREIESVQLGKSILERIKLITYSDFINMTKETSNENYTAFLGVEIPEGFSVEITVNKKTPATIEEAVLFNIRKEGEVIVRYMMLNEMTEVQLPYVKYFDRARIPNKPNLNSILIESSNSYNSTDLLEPVESNANPVPLNPDELDNWYSYDTKQSLTEEKYARRKNTDDQYDLFCWIPRHLEMGTEKIYLLGKTMYTLESYVREIEFPVGVFSNVIIKALAEKEGSPSSGDEDGQWIYVRTL